MTATFGGLEARVPSAGWLRRCSYGVPWLASKKVSTAPNTYRSYEGTWRVHIDPVLGIVPIGRINREVIREFLTEKMTRKVPYELSKDAVRIIHATLRAMLQEAVNDGIIPVNPARGVMKGLAKNKVERRKRIRFFTRDELRALFASAVAVAPGWFAYLFLLARAGVRPGEGLALKIGDVNCTDRFIDVERTYSRGQLGPTKGGKPRRVEMSEQLAAVLGDEIARRGAALRTPGAGEAEIQKAFLFVNSAGSLRDESRARKALHAVLNAAAIDRETARLHDLRHTFASLLIAEGADLVYVKTQMGHSSITVTVDTYGHLVPNPNRSVVNSLDDSQLEEILRGNIWKQSRARASTEGLLEKTKPPATQGVSRGGPPETRTRDPLIKSQLL